MVYYLDRETREMVQEPVWGKFGIDFLYRKRLGLSWLQNSLVRLLSNPFFSSVWGAYHDLSISKFQIRSFCKKFHIDSDEFDRPMDQFTSFNDFFIRKLKPEARPRVGDPHAALVFADARYTFYENIQFGTSFTLKGIQFDLSSFLQSVSLAERFSNGTMIIARLCPIDCHRFYFPYDGQAKLAYPIHGPLFSVNPVATQDRPWIFWTNKRVITMINLNEARSMAMVEVGATNCGTIVETYTPGNILKGSEKGYFKLGGSAIALLFEAGTFQLADDLKELSRSGLEVYCKIGQKLGTVVL